MTVRAKFKVDSYETQLIRRTKTPGDYGNMVTEESRTVKLSVVGTGSKENDLFWSYTPSGSISLSMVTPRAWEQFKLGAEVYVDFTPVTDDVVSKGSPEHIEKIVEHLS